MKALPASSKSATTAFYQRHKEWNVAWRRALDAERWPPSGDAQEFIAEHGSSHGLLRVDQRMVKALEIERDDVRDIGQAQHLLRLLNFLSRFRPSPDAVPMLTVSELLVLGDAALAEHQDLSRQRREEQVRGVDLDKDRTCIAIMRELAGGRTEQTDDRYGTGTGLVSKVKASAGVERSTVFDRIKRLVEARRVHRPGSRQLRQGARPIG